MNILFALITAASLTLISATSETAGSRSDRSVYKQEIVTMRIQKQVDCKGPDGNDKCFMVQKGASIGKDSWEMLPETIEGFLFEEGYIYDITVKAELLPNTDDDGRPHMKYTLINVLSKVKV